MAKPSTISATVIAAQAQVRQNFEKVVRDVLAKHIMDLAIKNTSLTDHTLKDLAALDHPYARRHPENSLHDDRKLHRQSGTLQTEFRDSTVRVGDRILYTLRNAAHYWPFLRDGTETMRPRSLGSLLNDLFVQDVWPEVVVHLREGYRAAFR
jgi:hypothetical protein